MKSKNPRQGKKVATVPQKTGAARFVIRNFSNKTKRPFVSVVKLSRKVTGEKSAKPGARKGKKGGVEGEGGEDQPDSITESARERKTARCVRAHETAKKGKKRKKE